LDNDYLGRFQISQLSYNSFRIAIFVELGFIMFFELGFEVGGEVGGVANGDEFVAESRQAIDQVLL